MNKPVVFGLFEADYFAKAVCAALGFTAGSIHIHQFPDQESLIQFETNIKDLPVIFIANLVHPNSKTLPLLFAAATAKELGAKHVTLIAPYLPYMRQDKAFHSGEGITSKYFANLINKHFDALFTIDPHLHRWHALGDIYSINTALLHATSCIAAWIKQHITQALLIGPDAESEQWISEIAKKTNAPYLILEKTRLGDHDVLISLPQLEKYPKHNIVLIDDIISSAATMIKTVNHLKLLNIKEVTCVGVHAIFADDAYQKLQATGIARIITCNTIPHESNAIDLNSIIIEALADKFQTS